MTELIGIDGGQGSGKTSYAHKLQIDLENQGRAVEYIETDDFLIERSIRDSLTPDFFDSIQNLNQLFDFERMGRAIQSIISSDEAITIKQLYNSATGKCDRSQIYVPATDLVLLVGGPYLLQPTWPKFTRKLFLDVPEKIRLERTLIRNKSRTRSVASQRLLFANFEKFYQQYWNGRLSEYDEVIQNY